MELVEEESSIKKEKLLEKGTQHIRKQGYVKNKSTIPGSSANARNASTSSWLYVPNCWPSDDCLPDKYATDKPRHECSWSAMMRKW